MAKKAKKKDPIEQLVDEVTNNVVEELTNIVTDVIGDAIYSAYDQGRADEHEENEKESK